MTDSYPVRPISAEEYPAFTAVLGEAFLEPWPPEAAAVERGVLELDRTIAAVDGPEIVGTATSYSFAVTVPGARARAAGISEVSVRPSYRRRGILTAMMRHQLSDARSRGEAIAILFASESGIYARYGFGLASWHLRLQIARGHGALRTGATLGRADSPSLRAVQPAQAWEQLAQVYATALPGRPGMVARDDRWWEAMLADPPALRDGMSPLRGLLAEDASGPVGYALYRTKPVWQDGVAAGTLRLRELVGTSPAASAALWSDLLDRDLVGEVVAPSRPIDDPLLAMLADPRRARASVNDALWVRLVDLPAALCQRRYSTGIDVVLDVIDPVFPDNAGRWHLLSGEPADGRQAVCERTSRPADVLLTVQAAGAAYLGGASFGQLAGAGHVRELTPGAAGRLATAMSFDPAPWTCQIF
jgi:predicted acetyltransferase